MSRPVDAIVTGFTKGTSLCEASLAPLRALKRDGVVRRIVYVTWSSPDIDAYVAPVAAMPDVDLVRVPSPQASGTWAQRGVVYQVRNLEAALAEIAGEDVLVVKSRPDFIANEAFLRRKIVDFDRLCAPARLNLDGIAAPASPFKAKIWLPWADANQPFFYEDGAFIGLKCDVAKLAMRKVENEIGVLGASENIYGPYAHVVRFAAAFRESMPIFKRYLRDYRFFVNNMDYRRVLVSQATQESFFWHLVVAHAWVLASNFHVDCGTPGDLRLYPNAVNQNADWTSIASLRLNPPFDAIDGWRSSTGPGALLTAVARLYGRLMDDAWQNALFSGPVSDIKPDALTALLKGAFAYRSGVLAKAEESFYGRLANVYREHWLRRAA